MQLNTVIFDMDGLLIDSEPLWSEAAAEVFTRYGIKVTEEQYAITTGLRTKEFVEWWFTHYKISMEQAEFARKAIIEKVIDKMATGRRQRAQASRNQDGSVGTLDILGTQSPLLVTRKTNIPPRDVCAGGQGSNQRCSERQMEANQKGKRQVPKPFTRSQKPPNIANDN